MTDQAETAQEAAMRAVTPLIQTIRDLSDDRRTADQLEPGQMVRAAGEWFTVDVVTEAGDLILLRDGHRMFYAVGAGEKFAWHQGAF